MKRVLINLGIVSALSLSMLSALVTTATAQQAKAKIAAPKTVVGHSLIRWATKRRPNLLVKIRVTAIEAAT